MRWRRETKGTLDRPLRLGRWAAGVTATVLLSGFVGALAERQGWFDFRSRPSIPAQLDAIRAHAAADGYGLIASKRIDLHGGGGTSFILALRSLRLLAGTGYGPPCDELRIYDVGDHELRLMFRFRPRAPADGRTWLFRLDSISDLDENGRPEIIGAWEELAMAPIWPRPVVIAWNDATGSYEMDPILDAAEAGLFHSNRPRLRLPAPPNGFAAGIRDVYTRPTLIRDAYSTKKISSYGAEDFVVGRVGFSTILAAIFITRGGSHADARADQVLLWSLDLLLPKPQVLSCIAPGGHPLIVDARYPLREWLRDYLGKSAGFLNLCR